MNLFDLPETLPEQELCETLWQKGTLRVERIISTGQCSPPGFWYDQSEDEWLTLLAGEALLRFEDGDVPLRRGDTLLIPAHRRHRVERTGANPPCVWLCVFAQSGQS